MNVLNIMELFTFKWLTLYYVNFTLFLKKLVRFSLENLLVLVGHRSLSLSE